MRAAIYARVSTERQERRQTIGSQLAALRAWAEAQDATSFCSESTIWPSLRTACGPYHVIAVAFIDTSRTYYYDALSGMLVAIITADAVQSSVTCDGGPTAGFTPPVCTQSMSQDLLQCRDGGVDVGD